VNLLLRHVTRLGKAPQERTHSELWRDLVALITFAPQYDENYSENTVMHCSGSVIAGLGRGYATRSAKEPFTSAKSN
jgi:hypothetical protein